MDQIQEVQRPWRRLEFRSAYMKLSSTNNGHVSLSKKFKD